MSDISDPFERLTILDPLLAARIQDGLSGRAAPLPDALVTRMVDDILWATGQEMGFGKAVADGYAALCKPAPNPVIERFGHDTRKMGQKGPTLGRITAVNLLPVLQAGDLSLADRFDATLAVMLQKGTYTLQGPFKVLRRLIDEADLASAAAYLELLKTAFAARISYNQSLHLTYSLPKAVADLPSGRRLWQIACLSTVISADIRLADSFLDGLARGLQTLNRHGLERFVDEGLQQTQDHLHRTKQFFALASERGRGLFNELRVAVSFRQAAPQLTRYLHARLGYPVSLRPLSALADNLGADSVGNALVATDGRTIYLADEIDHHADMNENQRLCNCLVRFEAGLLEFNTFDFDLDIWYDRNFGDGPDRFSIAADRSAACDLRHFLNLFENQQLAGDLFTIIEHGRIRVRMAGCYPGLVRQYLPLMQHAFRSKGQCSASAAWINRLYASIALDMDGPNDAGQDDEIRRVVGWFQDRIGPEAGAEDSAQLVWQTYPLVREGEQGAQPLNPPFGRRIQAAFFDASSRTEEQRIDRIRQQLINAGYPVYRSVVRRHLAQHRQLDADAVHNIIRESDRVSATAGSSRHAGPLEAIVKMDRLSDLVQAVPDGSATSAADAKWYKEWDFRMADYLNDHTRVIDRQVNGQSGEVYHRILEKYWGLIRQIRYSFELLRPEGLKICRQWIEGDEFDYRALVDFAVDRKSGRTPSDRLYIKRLKAERSVSVLLLMDLSRSTSNPVGGTNLSVLDVEKEAMVLLTEALDVIGDDFAIAGFSSNGRLGVDYYHIKDFGEPFDHHTRDRIDAIAPQRNTRMGAAIRHAAVQFESVTSRVRLLILLSDGFPNDVDYKKDYAVADTRRAVLELTAKQIHVHAITVNMKQDGIAVLDDLYGDVHHSLISDVIELPDKLLRIYGALTR